MKHKILFSIFLFLLFCFSISAADNTDKYRKTLDTGRKYEEKGNYVYALLSYWNAMELGFPSAGQAAYEAFTILSKQIESGNPFNYDLKNEENDPFEFYDLWKQQKDYFYKFFSSNNPYIYEIKEPQKKFTDYSRKTTDWSISIVTSEAPRYQVIEKIFNNGYKAALKIGLKYAKSSSWSSISDFPKCNISSFAIQDSAGSIICFANEIKDDVVVFKNVSREGTNKIRYDKIKYRIEAQNLDQKKQLYFPDKSYKSNANIYQFYENMQFTYYEKSEKSYPYYQQDKNLSLDIFYYVMDPYLKK